jgi:hypothetical protein
MNFKCIFNRHRFGLPRTNDDGVLQMECMQCAYIARSAIAFLLDSDAAIALNARRAVAIAELIAQKAWVGLVTNAPPTLAVEQRSPSGGSA